VSHGAVTMSIPDTPEHPPAPGPPAHFHQFCVASTEPEPRLDTPRSPNRLLKCASADAGYAGVTPDADDAAKIVTCLSGLSLYSTNRPYKA
jgi:hypothetical protein